MAPLQRGAALFPAAALRADPGVLLTAARFFGPELLMLAPVAGQLTVRRPRVLGGGRGGGWQTEGRRGCAMDVLGCCARASPAGPAAPGERRAVGRPPRWPTPKHVLRPLPPSPAKRRAPFQRWWTAT